MVLGLGSETFIDFVADRLSENQQRASTGNALDVPHHDVLHLSGFDFKVWLR